MALAEMNTYLIEADQYYDQTEKAERWNVVCAIPRVAWDADPWGATVPARGSDAPTGDDAYPAALGVAGNLLRRRLNLFSRPGWAMLHFTYGYDFTSVGINRAYVTGRTVLMLKSIPNELGGVILRGPVAGTDEKAEDTYREISPGYPREYEESYQMIRLHAYVDASTLAATAGQLQHLGGAVCSSTWTILGKLHAVNTLLYRGCQFDVYEHGSSPTYVARFDFLVARQAWPYVVRWTEYKDVGLTMPVLDTAGDVVGSQIAKTRQIKDVAGADILFRLQHDFTTELDTLLTGA